MMAPRLAAAGAWSKMLMNRILLSYLFNSVSFVCDDLAVLSSGYCSDIVCTSLDSSTSGTRLLNLQQHLPPVDAKIESCCPAIRSLPCSAAFPQHSVFDVLGSDRGVDGHFSQVGGASEHVRKKLIDVKQQLQQVRTFNKILAHQFYSVFCSF
jgi:hypothetical protein